ncbi:MAG: tRNA guanosine(34) transglycosylase Tgt, partial [Alphaproteobacteria bacterium]|nr:tRNA guanosine(34) transglycosylase Tgt [Alphaproteobacteria bacterium]
MTNTFDFTLHSTDGEARLGTVHTRHGDIRTPAFMPVGTVGTVKGLYLDQVEATGADIILGNTYHLMLRPGAEEVDKLGGLHHFIGWKRPILTDSGGFQIMSLSKIRKITEQGAVFQSHIDGKRHELTPERAMDIQRLLGSDIQMQLDQCIEFPHTDQQAEKAMQLSLRWAERSRKAFGSQPGRGNFGIVQGGINPKLRQESAEGLTSIGFEGYAIGGLAVGEGHALMLQAIEHTVPHLPPDKPRYLMGVGTP